jgi:hypothetical integral membrane protein (TIGR02206 family)
MHALLTTLAADTPAQLGFKPFTLTHVVTSGTYILLMLALVMLGRAWRNSPKQHALERNWFWFVLAVQAFNILFWSTPPRLDPAASLPLHICDLAGIFAVFSLAMQAAGKPNRILRTIMVYWGLGLSTQAFITPIIQDGPDTIRFHTFFLSHFTIVATPLYDVLVHRYRPTLRDFGIITLVTIIYGSLIIPINMHMGWNYGFAGATKPDNPTVIDKLGTYPLRLLWLFLIALIAYALITLIGGIKSRSVVPVAQASRL